MERHRLVESFNCALEGIVYVLKTQRNMRIHFAAAAVIIIAALIFNLSLFDFLFILFAIFLVLFAEMINTAAELTIDLISETYHPLARLVKDVGAGAVLIAAVNAVIIGYLVLAKHLGGRLEVGIESIKQSPLYVVFLALLVIFFATVLSRIVMRKGRPILGRMPSVHSALAFSAATLVMLIVPSSPLVVLLAYFLALMVAQSRIAAGVHTFTEVSLGALFGFFLTVLLYRLFLWIV